MDALVARERDRENDIEDVPIIRISPSAADENLTQISLIEQQDAPTQPEPIEGSMDHASVSSDS